ncbi:MAG: hypothetical protein LBQ76_07915 [Candidatus Fibromonas sp.]|jgi:hypothetical protein|nr:hypothetical protein [Candidatus Fibromonas sp.]
MFKKMVAASAAFVLFACSSGDDDNGNPGGNSSPGTGGEVSSSSLPDEPSSSSVAKVTVLDTGAVSVSAFNAASSQIFKTYPYGYTLKAGEAEDLTQFWDVSDPECPVENQGSATPPEKCALDKTNAILQNVLTNRYADLHYIVDGISLGYPNQAIKLDRYNLTGEGDQAALGINLGAEANEGKNLEELGKTELNGTVAFAYRYWGGAHSFRAVSKVDDDFWYFEVPAKTDTVEVKIFLSEFAGMGSFAANEEEGTEGTPFDLSKVAKFLWVVEYDAEAPGKNQGSLLVDYLSALVEYEHERTE